MKGATNFCHYWGTLITAIKLSVQMNSHHQSVQQKCGEALSLDTQPKMPPPPASSWEKIEDIVTRDHWKCPVSEKVQFLIH